MQDGEETVYLIWDIHIMTYHQLNMRLKFNTRFNHKGSKSSDHLNNVIDTTLPTEKTTKFHVTRLDPRSNFFLLKEDVIATNQSMLIPEYSNVFIFWTRKVGLPSVQLSFVLYHKYQSNVQYTAYPDAPGDGGGGGDGVMMMMMMTKSF